MAIFLAVVAPLLIKSGSDAWFGYRDQRAMLDSLLRAEAKSASNRVESFLYDIRDRLSWTVQQPWAAKSIEEHYIDALHLLRHVPAVGSVTLVNDADKEGLFVSRIALNRIGSATDYSKTPDIVGARRDRSWFSKMEYSSNSEPRMTIAVAGGRKGAGAAIAEINLKLIRDAIAQIHVGRTGYAFVLNQSGQLVAHPDISKVLLANSSLPAMQKFEDSFQDSHEQAITTTDPDGVTVLATMAPPVKGTNWKVFVVQPISEAFAPIYVALWRTGGLLIAAAVAAAILAYLLARRMVGPIRLLEDGAERIGAGQFDHRITVSTGDEFERLAHRFNRMAEELAVSQERAERIARLKRFLAPQVAELVERTGDETVLGGQRAEVVAVFCDLRGFTAFTEQAEPEVIMEVLGSYYRTMGSVIVRYQATLTNFAADGLMILVNAPVPCPQPALHAVRMALDMQAAVQHLTTGWRVQGYDIGFGMGLAMGWATVGRVGYEGRVDYTAIGSVVNLASRLCSSAEDRQILFDKSVALVLRATLPVTELGTRQLKGYDRQVAVYTVTEETAGSKESPSEKTV